MTPSVGVVATRRPTEHAKVENFTYDDGDFTGAVNGEKKTKVGQPDKIGVDLNRNGPFKWHPPHEASNDPGDADFYPASGEDPVEGPYYRGSSPGSEPETAAVGIARWYYFFFPNTRANIFYHSKGGQVVYPWGYRYAPVGADPNDPIGAADGNLALGENDGDKFQELGSEMANLSGYSWMQASKIPPHNHLLSGNYMDWLYAGDHHSASFTIEVYNHQGEQPVDYNPPTEAGKNAVVDENIKSAMFLIRWAASEPQRGGPAPRR